MYGRDMTHTVKHRVKDQTGAAYTQACRYPDGTNVLCATVIELDSGVIAGQTVVPGLGRGVSDVGHSPDGYVSYDPVRRHGAVLSPGLCGEPGLGMDPRA